MNREHFQNELDQLEYRANLHEIRKAIAEIVSRLDRGIRPAGDLGDWVAFFAAHLPEAELEGLCKSEPPEIEPSESLLRFVLSRLDAMLDVKILEAERGDVVL